MKQKNIAWKVVRKQKDGTLVSAFRNTNPIKYGIGMVSKPLSSENQFLFVFSTRAQARLFVGYTSRYNNLRIYKCRVTNLKIKTMNKDGYLVRGESYCDSTGTLFADTVELLHRA